MVKVNYQTLSLGETLAAGAVADYVGWRMESGTARPDEAQEATHWFGHSQHIRISVIAIGDYETPNAIQVVLDCGSTGAVTFSSAPELAEGVLNESLRIHWHEVLAGIDVTTHDDANEGTVAWPFRARLEQLVTGALPPKLRAVMPIAVVRLRGRNPAAYAGTDIAEALTLASEADLISWMQMGQSAGNGLTLEYRGASGDYEFMVYTNGADEPKNLVVAIRVRGPHSEALFTSAAFQGPHVVVEGLAGAYAALSQAIQFYHHNFNNEGSAAAVAFQNRIAEQLAEVVTAGIFKASDSSEFANASLASTLTLGAGLFSWRTVNQAAEVGLFCVYEGCFGIFVANIYVDGDDHDHPTTVALSLGVGKNRSILVASRPMEVPCTVDEELLTIYPALAAGISPGREPRDSLPGESFALTSRLLELFEAERPDSEGSGAH